MLNLSLSSSAVQGVSYAYPCTVKKTGCRSAAKWYDDTTYSILAYNKVCRVGWWQNKTTDKFKVIFEACKGED